MGSNLGTNAAVREIFIHDQEASCLGNGAQNGVHVERGHGTRVDEFYRDAFGGEGFTGRKRLVHHQRECDDGDIAAFADDGGLTEVDEIFFLRHRSLHRHELAMFEEQHGIVTGERGLE